MSLLTGHHQQGIWSERFSVVVNMRHNMHHAATLSVLLVSVLLAVIFGGCQRVKQSPEQVRAVPHQPVKEAAKQIVVNVFEDEAMLRGSHALIGGTIKNISGEKLESLSVELELTRRDQDGSEMRKIAVAPADLLPRAEGRYQLSLLTREWSSARVLRVWHRAKDGAKDGAKDADVAFASFPGARRPRERPPQIKVEDGTAPRSKAKGEEFINTPDTPSSIP